MTADDWRDVILLVQILGIFCGGFIMGSCAYPRRKRGS